MKELSIAVKDIFPELKKSKEEKIRKDIIKAFKVFKEKQAWVGHCLDDIDWDACISWLEKQGDKVSAIEGFETEFERQVSSLIASTINKEYEYNQGYVKWTANALLNYAKHELEKQGKQKPAEWNEEDEKYLKLAIENFQMLGNSFLTAWLKSLKDRVQPQSQWKPSSELDEASYQVGIKRVLENPESYGLTKYNWKPSDEADGSNRSCNK